MTEPLWGVGRYHDGRAHVAWEVSHGEIQRDMGSSHRRLTELGVGPGGRVLVCSLLGEAAHFWPWIVGTMLTGAQLSCADATRGDGPRVAMFCRLLDFRAVLGVDGAVLDGLDDAGVGYEEAFAGIEVVAARPGAYERLEAAGLAPHRLVLVGPAVAVSDEPGGAARVDADAWRLDDGPDGQVLVTSRTPRATTFERAPTSVRGTVLDDDAVVPEEVR